MNPVDQANLNAAGALYEANIILRGVSEEKALFELRPSTRYMPKLTIDGNQWCALFGDNIQDGVCGFGDSPDKAFYDFDRAWYRSLK